MLGTSVDSLGFPSVGRVVFGFLVTAALAVGVALVLRKGWPLWLRRKRLSSAMHPLDRAVVSRTLTVHLVEIDGARVIIAEGRSGVGMTVLSQGSARPAE